MLKYLKQKFQTYSIEQSLNYLKHEINFSIQEKDFDTAEKHLRRCLDLSSKDLETQFTLVKVLRKLGKLEEGLELLLQIEEFSPEWEEQAVHFFDIYKQQRKEQIPQLVEDILSYQEDVPKIRVLWSQYLFECSKIDEAQEGLEKILQTHENDIEALTGLAYCYISKGEKMKALAQVSKIKEKDPGRADEVLSAIYENIQNF